jgi:hypothetical protein
VSLVRQEDVRPFIEEQRLALLSGDLKRFLATFVLEGHDEPALTAWFAGYAGPPAPTRVDAAIEGSSDAGDPGHVKVAFTFSWPGFDDLTEHADYEVSWRETGTRQRVKRFWLRRDLPAWPDRPSGEPLAFAPPGTAGPNEAPGRVPSRVLSRPRPVFHPAVVGAVAPGAAGWPELGAVVCQVKAAGRGRAAPRIEVVARDETALAAALPAVTGWLAAAAGRPGGAGAWGGALVPGAPGGDDWRRASVALRRRPAPAAPDDGARFSDPVPARLLERAVNRLPRYREAHYEIGQAAILAEMMSRTTAGWAFELQAADAAGVLAYLSRRFARRVAAGENLPRPPGVPRSQRRPLPWGGLDEALAIRGSYGESRAPCGTLGPVYAAVLRLSGFDPFTVYNVWMPARIVAVIILERAAYLVSNHSVVVMWPKTRYWARVIHRLSADAWFWDQSGATDAPPEAVGRYRDIFARYLPAFTIPGRADPVELVAPGFWGGRSADFSGPAGLAAAVRRYVEYESARRPTSAYTWARYAFQTLRVAHPQVYLAAGMKSRDVEEAAASCASRRDVLRWAEGLAPGSIFPEPDRLMTPDQVIRYRRGRPADVACAVAAMCARRFGDRPLVHVAGGAAYLLLGGEGRRRWLRARDLVAVDAPSGPLEAAWDAASGWTRWSTLDLPPALVQDL